MLQGLESFCIPTERKIQPGGGGGEEQNTGRGLRSTTYFGQKLQGCNV